MKEPTTAGSFNEVVDAVAGHLLSPFYHDGPCYRCGEHTTGDCIFCDGCINEWIDDEGRREQRKGKSQEAAYQ